MSDSNGAQNGFDRNRAFSRTLGFVSPEELSLLEGKTIAIAGLGGVGGNHLLTLTRLGVGGFHLSDFDVFELENFNRQAGANLRTIGKKKLEVMADLAQQINPELRMALFSEGIQSSNIDRFLDGVDVYVDGLDFFAFKTRIAVFEACRNKGIPAVTVGPIGMGAALMNFLPGKMSFLDYFQFKENDSDEALAVKLLVGITPSLAHTSYVVDPRFVDFKKKRGPSTPMACEICAGILGTEVLKILLGRGKVHCAPTSILFDAYQNHLYKRWIPFGNRNPLQKLKIHLGLRQLRRG